MKAKILYVITKSNWGGAQRYVYDLATHLDTNNFDVTVVLGAPSDKTQESGKGILLKKLHDKKVRTIVLPELTRDVDLFREFMALWRLFLVFRRERPDIVHLNSSKAGGLGAFVARYTFPRRIIFTVHGFPHREKRGVFATNLIRFFSWLTIALADVCITMTKEDYEEARSMPIVKNKIRFILNGIEAKGQINREDTRTIIATHLSENLGHTPARHLPWIGIVAELTQNKGIIFALQALRELMREKGNSSCRCIIIGGGELKDEFDLFVKENDMVGQVFLAGFVPNASTLLTAFDIFLLPSIKEGLPYVILEAGLASLPVIATRVGEIPGIIENNVNGILIERANSEAIYLALRRLLDDPARRKQMGEKLKETVSTKFDLGHMLKETTALYKVPS